MNSPYTLHWIDTGIVIQSGQVPRPDLYPSVPDGAMITEGIEANPETERVKDGKAVPYDRPRENEELFSAIERERGRRLAAGFDFDFKDSRGVHRIGTTDADERGWDKVTKLSTAYLLSGNPGVKIQIVTETGPVEVTAAEWQEILIAAGAFQQPIYALSFVLQTMTPIPQDVENPSYWGQN